MVVLAVVLYALNILLILQLIPVLESQTINAKIVNLFVFPANFLFEDLLGINSVKSIDILTWVLQFVYVYIISAIVIYLVKGGLNKK